MSSAIASADGSLTPWRSARFVALVMLIPMASLIAILLWQYDAQYAFRAVQLSLAWAVIGQLIIVVWRVFDRGWYEFFAYMLHFVMIGVASLTVTFRLELYPPGLPYDQFAVMGLAGQLMIGVLQLANGPLQVRARLDANVLAICAVIVCTAALVKFGFYIQYVGLAGGHAAIYTEGDAVRDNSPAIIRILAAGAPLIGLLALTQPGLPLWCRFLGAFAIVLEFAIGIRGRPLYIVLSAVAIMQRSIRLTSTKKVLIILTGFLALIAIAGIGYFREDNHMGAADYFWVILESLFGIFEAGVFSDQLPTAPPIVIGQIIPLLTPTALGSIDTISKLISVTYSQKAYLLGYGYSSSALTEVNLLFGLLVSSLLYPLLVLGVIQFIKAALTSRQIWLFLYGASVVPIAFYIWRAELWQLVVPAIKGLPFISVLLMINAFAGLGRHKPASPLLGTKQNSASR